MVERKAMYSLWYGFRKAGSFDDIHHKSNLVILSIRMPNASLSVKVHLFKRFAVKMIEFKYKVC